MNTGQMLLVIGGIVLLSTVALSVNETLLQNEEMVVASQAGVEAVSLCEAVIEGCVATGFDSLTVATIGDTLLTPFAAFVCTTRVNYVLIANPDSTVVTPTRMKRVLVEVSSNYMPGTVSMAALVGKY